MSKKSPENFARAIAVISLIVALAAIAIPYFQQEGALKQQQEQFEALQREGLSVKLSPYVSGEIRLTENDLGLLGHVVQVPWRLTVSNTGSRQLSIARYDLSSVDSVEYYSGIDGGLVTKNSQPVDLPRTLEPGETQSFFLFIGIIVPRTVYEILKELDEGNDIQRIDATIALAREGVDLYGNKVDYTEFEEGAYHITIDSVNQKAKMFSLTIYTGRDNTFIVSASEYERPGASAP
ncbi:hypothetical protein [Halomonas litopenaei]|uniref:hypothetical protein n=1 Tax=Halomonas litopenaei TaxID=2109328 RepID=UPI003FA0F520